MAKKVGNKLMSDKEESIFKVGEGINWGSVILGSIGLIGLIVQISTNEKRDNSNVYSVNN